MFIKLHFEQASTINHFQGHGSIFMMTLALGSIMLACSLTKSQVARCSDDNDTFWARITTGYMNQVHTITTSTSVLTVMALLDNNGDGGRVFAMTSDSELGRHDQVDNNCDMY